MTTVGTVHSYRSTHTQCSLKEAPPSLPPSLPSDVSSPLSARDRYSSPLPRGSPAVRRLFSGKASGSASSEDSTSVTGQVEDVSTGSASQRGRGEGEEGDFKVPHIPFIPLSAPSDGDCTGGNCFQPK